ncbi:MAG: CBS domain-containing protein, partial [Methanosarcinales archaeon]
LVGKIFAGMMVLAGLLKADPISFILTGEWGYNLWLPLLGLFLYMAAAEEEKATITFASLEGIKVKHVMRTERTSVSEYMPLLELVRKMLEERTAEYVVVNDSGDLKGFITITTVKKVPVEQRHLLSVSDVMSPYDRIGRLISNEEESAEALKIMIRDKLEFLAVKDDKSGDFTGIITRKDLAIYIEMLSGRF